MKVLLGLLAASSMLIALPASAQLVWQPPHFEPYVPTFGTPEGDAY